MRVKCKVKVVGCLLVVAVLMINFVVATPNVRAVPISVDFTTLGTFTTPSLSQGGITVTGSSDVSVLNLNGLGIVGGFTNNTLDVGELMRFDFDAGPATNVFLANFGIGNGPATADFQGFGTGGGSLGIVSADPFPATNSFDVSALFSGQMLSAFELTLTGTRSETNTRITEIMFTPIPEPATMLLLGIGLVGLAGGAVRRRFKRVKK